MFAAGIAEGHASAESNAAIALWPAGKVETVGDKELIRLTEVEIQGRGLVENGFRGGHGGVPEASRPFDAKGGVVERCCNGVSPESGHVVHVVESVEDTAVRCLVFELQRSRVVRSHLIAEIDTKDSSEHARVSVFVVLTFGEGGQDCIIDVQ